MSDFVNDTALKIIALNKEIKERSEKLVRYYQREEDAQIIKNNAAFYRDNGNEKIASILDEIAEEIRTGCDILGEH